jgi:hypothetical protein
MPLIIAMNTRTPLAAARRRYLFTNRLHDDANMAGFRDKPIHLNLSGTR